MNVQPHTCRNCKQQVEVAILPDRGRQFYVGARCGCGAYSRETPSMSLVGAVLAFEDVEL